MTISSHLRAGPLARKGEASPPPEPPTRHRPSGRRVSTTLPHDLYVALKTHVATSGFSGEQVILAALRKMLEA